MNRKTVIEAVLSKVDHDFITAPRSDDTDRGNFAAVICLRKNESGKVESLLVSKPKDISGYSSEWSFPGGEQEIGETLLETAVRELDEETSLSVNSLGPVTCWQITAQGREHKKVFFVCTEENLSGDLFRSKADEDIDKAEWFLLNSMLYRLPLAHRQAVEVLEGKIRLRHFSDEIQEAIDRDFT